MKDKIICPHSNQPCNTGYCIEGVCSIIEIAKHETITVPEILKRYTGADEFICNGQNLTGEIALAVRAYAVLPDYDYHDGGSVNCHLQYIEGFNDGVKRVQKKLVLDSKVLGIAAKEYEADNVFGDFDSFVAGVNWLIEKLKT